MASIIIISGSQRGHRVQLGQDTISIGRDEACDVRLDDGRTSRRHAEIGYDPESERHFVRDAGSRNGVRLNERTTTEATLHNGDVLVIGDCQLMFSDRNFADQGAALAWCDQRATSDTGPTIAARHENDDWQNA